MLPTIVDDPSDRPHKRARHELPEYGMDRAQEGAWCESVGTGDKTHQLLGPRYSSNIATTTLSSVSASCVESCLLPQDEGSRLVCYGMVNSKRLREGQLLALIAT